MKKVSVFETIEDTIQSLDVSDRDRTKLLDGVLKLKKQKVNLMITGATGCGKSSTINALFNTEVAKVGVGVDPETMVIKKHELNNLILWDSPGLGDGKEKDAQHSKGIIKKLSEVDSKGEPVIDLVLVILDGSTRDLGTSYDLINKVIIPNLGSDAKNRILIAVNQADMAMKGRFWNFETNQPEPKLLKFLEEKVLSIKQRVKEATSIDVEPIYYSAGYKGGEEEQSPWNLSKLLCFIVKNTPENKRLSYVDNLSNEKESWKDNDGNGDYQEEVQKSFQDVAGHLSKNTLAGAAAGAAIGSVIPVVGTAIGSAVGAAVGFIGGLFGW
ncbi:GTP-binding protein [Leucothrix sargassi]|nr:GTP-binding protein [Leucothrix sargassi]